MERKDAIEVIKKNWPDSSFTMLREALETLIPELKESEDEKIRKSLLEYLHTLPNHYAHSGVCAPEWIAWLEKQGEQIDFANKEYWRGYREGKQEILDKYAELERQSKQKLVEKYGITGIGSKNAQGKLREMIKNLKSADKIEPKFKVGDTIKPKDGGHEPWRIMQVDILDKKYRFKDGYVIHFSQEDDYELVGQKPAEWTHKDGKNLAELWEILSVHRNTNPQVDNLMEWVKDLVSYKRQEWNEEDEEMLNLIIARLHSHPNVDLEEYGKEYDWLNYNLKSLRHQKQWKPSEEQMKALHDLNLTGDISYPRTRTRID